ncbi:hypothetical protein X777_01889 [Ooceraea biroi]|uniref:Uncharacterized protein n=2 Tax=Ooceraea biroi TaxID=2015173 RepID=A0A026WQB6_OOCBI|nr:hypothetical protein X777_01889 [Ooceraea biroi]
MSKCVTLLMQVLKESNDSRMLMQLCIQLGKIPDSDKKYLRDSEREQLSRQALTLCQQSLRSRVQAMGSASMIDSVHLIRTDARTQVLLDVYETYQLVQKNFQGKESTIQTFATLLTDTYKMYIGNKNLEGNILEIAIKCCQRQIQANKIASISSSNSCHMQAQVASTISAPTPQVPVNSTSPQASQNRKPHKNVTTMGRPRGRPPNINKYLPHTLQQGGNMMNQFSKGNFASYLNTSGPNRSMMNPYFINPIADANMLSAILTSGLGSNMMDPISAMSYLNQMGSYQNIFRQYQSNFSLSNLTGGLSNSGTTMTGINSISTMSTSSSNVSASNNIGNLGALNNMTVKQLLNLSNSTASTSRPTPMYHQTANKTSSSTMSMTKDRPNISITPVTTSMSQQPHHKTKLSKQPNSQTESTLPVHIPKSLQISPTKPVLHSTPSTAAQVSLLKPSVIQQVKTSPPKQMNVPPQIRVSKSLTEPQPAHNPALSHSPLKTSGSSAANPTSIPQIAHTSIGAPVAMKQQQTLPMSLPSVSRSGTSLQHKLLSKKNSQRPYSHANVQSHSMRKAKATGKTAAIPVSMSGNFPTNLLNAIPSGNSGTMSQPPFIPPELSGISVSAVGPQSGTIKSAAASTKYHNYKKSISKPKPTATAATAAIDMPSSSLAASFPQSNSVEALSMLSQLQQHSHLEIIPQQKAPLKPNIDYSKSLSSSVNVMPQKVSETLRSSTATECMPMYDMSRNKPANIPSKKAQEKLANDSVEIITLDD